MKILIVYAKYPEEVFNRKAALGSYIHCLANLLSDEGNEIHINGIPLNEKKVRSLNNSSVSKSNPIKKIVPDFIKRIISDKQFEKKYDQLFESISTIGKYDLIIEFYSYLSNVGLRLKQKQMVPLITIFDAPVLDEYEHFHSKKRINRKKLLDRQDESLKNSDTVIVYNEPMKKFVSAITGKSENIFVHQNIDFTRFDFSNPIPSDELNIAFIGSFLQWHRVDLLLDAFDRVAEKNKKIRLFLIGDGLEWKNMQEQSKKLKNNQRINFTGFLDGEQLKDMRNKMHIGIMPGSNWYGAPNKIFEYGAAGMVVIAPDTPAITSLFNHEEVVFFKQDDLSSLTKSIEDVCNDESLRNDRAKKLKEKIKENYSTEKTVRFYMDRIKSLK